VRRYEWGGTLTAPYVYTSANGISCVSLYTSGTGTRQTRAFLYDDSGRLTSALNPENGTVTYTYNSDNTLWYKHDAKGQDAVYTTPRSGSPWCSGIRPAKTTRKIRVNG
jgi:YD repeat-containing protein